MRLLIWRIHLRRAGTNVITTSNGAVCMVVVIMMMVIDRQQFSRPRPKLSAVFRIVGYPLRRPGTRNLTF
jgi:hypothetical protein